MGTQVSTNQYLAQVSILEHKLATIRDIAENCVSTETYAPEMEAILHVIKRFEVVDAGWKLNRPIVEEEIK